MRAASPLACFLSSGFTFGRVRPRPWPVFSESGFTFRCGGLALGLFSLNLVSLSGACSLALGLFSLNLVSLSGACSLALGLFSLNLVSLSGACGLALGLFSLNLVSLSGACGLALGLFYRFSCLVFAGGHCYLFLLDKTSWNNHSYLYALCSLMFLIFDADRYW